MQVVAESFRSKRHAQTRLVRLLPSNPVLLTNGSTACSFGIHLDALWCDLCVQFDQRQREALVRAEELMHSGGVAALETAKAADAEFAKWLVRLILQQSSSCESVGPVHSLDWWELCIFD
jgi:hypothetical protein